MKRALPLFTTAVLWMSSAAPAQAAAPVFAELLRLAGGPQDIPVFTGAPRSAAQAVIVAADGARVIGEEALARALDGADLVYSGEQHDQELHHRIQLAVLKAMHARRPGLAVGLEMLDLTQQPSLDAYLSGRMSEAEFAQFWKKAWGFDYELYRPILSYAKDNGIPCRALNAPSSIIKQIAKGGLGSLTPQQRALLPETIAPIDDPRYLAYVKASLNGHGQALPPEREARMLEAMQTWNETMGESALKALRERGAVLVVAGSGHMIYGSGIAESVRRRAGPRQKVVLPYPTGGDESVPLAELLARLQDRESEDIQFADFFWLLPQAD